MTDRLDRSIDDILRRTSKLEEILTIQKLTQDQKDYLITNKEKIKNDYMMLKYCKWTSEDPIEAYEQMWSCVRNLKDLSSYTRTIMIHAIQKPSLTLAQKLQICYEISGFE